MIMIWRERPPALFWLMICFGFMLSSCNKSRDGGTGGHATLRIDAYWKNPNAGDSRQPAPVDVIYIWYDGNNADALFQPRDPATADTVCYGNPNENFISIHQLRRGNYGWVLLSKVPAMWKTYSARGSTYISWKNRKRETRLEVEVE